jgi:hypothetical protein
MIEKREFTLGSHVYELSVRDELGGYYGAWFCRTCHAGGVKYELSPSVENAFGVAVAGAERHESQNHPAN